MAAANYDTLLPEVLMYAAQCPEPVAINAIRNACIEFCGESWFLQQDMDPIPIVANEVLYEVDAPSGYDVVQVLKPLYYSGAKLSDFAAFMVTSQQDWQQHTGTHPLAWTCFQPDEITVWPRPTSSGASLTGRIAVAPTVTSTTVEARLLTKYRLALRDGALAQILDYPDQPFTNPEKAKQFAAAFRSAMMNARVRVRQGFVSAPMHVRLDRSW